ncbi:MAG: phosphoribosylamine--glycine ligase [Acetanaerobacterium sp.]
MNVLVVGGGGREHAVIKKLIESDRIKRLYCTPGNGGICANADCVNLKATDIDMIAAFAQQHEIDFAVVTPDDPLVLGLVDVLEGLGIRCFGPSKKAAQIEGSKIFSKNLMKKYGIPTAAYEVFDRSEEAIAYVKAQDSYPVVIKADGLALGKGVIIAQDLAEATEAIRGMIDGGRFGASGSHVVIEEFLRGPEATVLAFTDGKTIKPMVSSMDHKRALDGDMGPNTGGMGTIAPNPHYTPELERMCMETIFLPTIRALQSEGAPFKGCLYFGLMLTPKGPYVIEYNCRFGDPEAQVVLPLLETDLLTVFEAVADERLAELDIEWEQGAAACVVMASGGYPQAYEKGKEITGLDEVQSSHGVTVYHAGTRYDDGRYYTAGGRVLGVTAKGKTLPAALTKAYEAVEKIHFEGAHYRTDIGKR